MEACILKMSSKSEGAGAGTSLDFHLSSAVGTSAIPTYTLVKAALTPSSAFSA